MTAPEPTGAAPDPSGDASAAHGRAAHSSTEALRAVFRRALRDVLVLVTVIAVVGIAAGAALRGTPGVWGALIGTVIVAVFSGSTVVAMLRTAGSSVTTASAALVGTWIAKMLLLIVAIAVLRDLDFYDSGVLGVVVIVGVLGSVFVDFRAVSTGRVPYTGQT
ncbi:hypothetical protein [Actinotalea sp. K2]|uniref:hypothetical protein n=1 Tax=Actinotalea sp. K2 TaxID=2939438 RepID=UPI00201730BA|nr:hypothetical protein [Actinotalea sp. K2]MCL3860447.1 hypothetical protein [Actinotalea sp. K2]